MKKVYFISMDIKIMIVSSTTTTTTITITTVYFNEVVFPSILRSTSPMAFPQHSPF